MSDIPVAMIRQRARWRGALNLLGPMLGLLLVCAGFALFAPATFLSVGNLETIVRQTTVVGTAALGMTIVMIAGGIDLSVGSIVALGTVVTAWFLRDGASPVAAAAAGIAVGALCGCVNGLLITRLKVVPFIVTLGMLLVVRGAAKGIAGQQKIDAPITWLGELLAALRAEHRWMLVPVGVWLMLALAVAVAVLLRMTRMGRHMIAVGSNEETARLCGIPVGRTKLIVYVLGGAFAGLAGLMQFSRLTVGDPTVAQGLELEVIAAVVIGGGSLAGGEGSVLGTLCGALIMTVIANGCSQIGLENWVQQIATGVVIVIAVALDRLRHRRMA
jgi:ribose transport system permease protein